MLAGLMWTMVSIGSWMLDSGWHDCQLPRVAWLDSARLMKPNTAFSPIELSDESLLRPFVIRIEALYLLFRLGAVSSACPDLTSLPTDTILLSSLVWFPRCHTEDLKLMGPS